MGIRSIELWDRWPQQAGASRLAILSGVSDPEDVWRVGGEVSHSVSVGRGTATAPEGTLERALADDYALIRAGRVLRYILDDGDIRDRRVLEVRDGSDDRGKAALVAGGYSTSLAKTPPISMQVGGSRMFRFDGLLSVADQLSNHIMPAITGAGLSFFAVGEVVPTQAPIVGYDGDNAWSGLKKLADAVDCDVWFRPDLEHDVVYIDILPRDGSILIDGSHERDGEGNLVVSDGKPVISSAFGDQITDPEGPPLVATVNAEIKRTRGGGEQATIVYGLGEENSVLGDALWIVTAKDDDEVELADLGNGPGPIGFDDQLNGLYLEAANRSTRVAITDSIRATQSVVVSDGSSFIVGDRVRVCADAGGATLLSLGDPAAIAAFGAIPDTLKRPDIAPTVNLVDNADQSLWTGSSSDPADGWATVGAPTITRETDGAHRETGQYSAKVETTQDGEGLACPLTSLLLTPDDPYASGAMNFKLVSGAVRIEMVATDGVDAWLFPDGQSQRAVTTILGQFVKAGVAGIDLLSLGASSARMRLVQDGPTPAVFYVDSAQITESAGQLPMVIGSGPTQLWQAVNQELALRGLGTLRYEGRVVDFQRAEPLVYPHLKLIPGAIHPVTDADLGLIDGVRLLEVREKWSRERDATIVLSTLPSDIRSLRNRQLPSRTRAILSGSQVVPRSGAARTIRDLATTASSDIATSATAEFVAGDEGATIWIWGAGTAGAILKATVDAVSSETEIKLGTDALATLTNALAVIGTPEGVLSLAAGFGTGAPPRADADAINVALINAQIRELAKRLAEIGDNGGGGSEPGEPGEPGPPGNGYAPIVVSAATYVAEEPEVLEVTAPAIGLITRLSSFPPSDLEILGAAAATVPEVSQVAGDTDLIPAVPAVNRETPRADRWHVRVTPTGDPWAVTASHHFGGYEFPEVPGSYPLNGTPITDPGSTGAGPWWSDGDYYVSAWWISFSGIAEGMSGDSVYPLNAGLELPSAEEGLTVDLWANLTTRGAGGEPQIHLLLSQAGQDRHIIAGELKREFDDVEEVYVYILTLSTTNGSSVRTVVDSDSIVLPGNQSPLALHLHLERTAWNTYDMTLRLGAPDFTTAPTGESILTIPSPDLTVSASDVISSGETNIIGYRLVGLALGEEALGVAPTQLGFGIGGAGGHNTYHTITAEVMPLYYVDPPEP